MISNTYQVKLVKVISSSTELGAPINRKCTSLLHIHTFNMFLSLITSLLLGVCIAANECPLDPINCTIPYDDLNISTVVIINATQYCHVDNCTVKIIKTGDELNIAYHNDQYHLGCTTTTLQLLEVNDNTTSYCEQEYDDNKLSLFLIVANYALLTIGFALNILILIVIIKQKKYSSLPFRLLLVSTILWIAMHLIIYINILIRHTTQAPNGFCITILIMFTSLLQGANIIETEIVFTIFYTFYRCYKLYSVLSEEATRKLFRRSIAVMVGVIIIFNISRVLIIVLQEASYVSPAGNCVTLSDVYRVTPFIQYIGIALYTNTVIVQMVFSVCSGILLHILSKNNNSTQTDSSHKCLLKIAVILSSVSLASRMVYTLAVYLLGEYSTLLGTCVGICERSVILCMLLNKDDIKKFCKCI